jgi:hypothetical protein
MNLKEIELESANLINLAQDREHWWPVMKAATNFRGPYNV